MHLQPMRYSTLVATFLIATCSFSLFAERAYAGTTHVITFEGKVTDVDRHSPGSFPPFHNWDGSVQNGGDFKIEIDLDIASPAWTRSNYSMGSTYGVFDATWNLTVGDYDLSFNGGLLILAGYDQYVPGGLLLSFSNA